LESVARASRWLASMQNADGGFPAFVHGLRSKPAGPILTAPLVLRLRRPSKALDLLASLSFAMGDPSTEDVTGRVLRAVAGARSIGASGSGPNVGAALAFLRAQQCSNGAFWGRWSTNYLWATAHVILGAVGAGVPVATPWLRRAADHLVAHQNDDGG